MATLNQQRLHPHNLNKAYFPNEFTCKACKTPGNGIRYRCSQGCGFDLHEYCATCPHKLQPNFMHPKHKLKLQTPHQGNHSCFPWPTPSSRKHNESLACDLCGDYIDIEEASFYRCRACDFNVHLLCTQLPQHTNHRRHRGYRDHQLRLCYSKDHYLCGVCKEECRNWRYSCERERCRVDIHIKCITTDVGRSRWNISQILLKLAKIAAVGLIGQAAGGLISLATG